MEKIGREKRPGTVTPPDEQRFGTCESARTDGEHRVLEITMDDGEKLSLATELIEAAFEIEEGDRVSLRGHRPASLAKVDG